MELLTFSTYMIVPSANRSNLTFLILIWMLFISFSCLIVLATSSTMLIRSDESGNPPYCIQFYRKTFNFLLPHSLFSFFLRTPIICMVSHISLRLCLFFFFLFSFCSADWLSIDLSSSLLILFLCLLRSAVEFLY